MLVLQRQTVRQEAAYVCVANLWAAMTAKRDAAFREIENNSLLTIPDGMPLVWYAWALGETAVRRVTGPDLMLNVLDVSPKLGYSHYFYGDTEGTLAELTQTVESRFPGTRIKGTCSPPFRELSDEELHAVAEEINRLKPTFVWVALACPKQERWMARILPMIDSSILIGVGAAFRFAIGQYRHPAKVFQLCGLEGVFWRARRHPFLNIWWYSCHIPKMGLLLLKAVVHRILQDSRKVPRVR